MPKFLISADVENIYLGSIIIQWLYPGMSQSTIDDKFIYRQ